MAIVKEERGIRKERPFFVIGNKACFVSKLILSHLSLKKRVFKIGYLKNICTLKKCLFFLIQFSISGTENFAWGNKIQHYRYINYEKF